MRLKLKTIEKLFLLILPTAMIVLQWISFAGINLSWILSIILFIKVLKKVNIIIGRPMLLVFFLAIITVPLNFWLGLTSKFNTSLYFSILTGCIYMFYIIFLNNKNFHLFLQGCLFSVIVFILWGIFEIFTGYYILATQEAFTTILTLGNFHYPMAAFPNTNDFAQYISMLFPVCSLMLLRFSKIYFSILFSLSLFILYCSGSRLCMITFIVIFAMYYLFVLFHAKKIKLIGKLLGGICVFCIVLFAFDSKTGVISNIIDNFFMLSRQADYYTERQIIYKNIINMIKILPFGGFGTSYAIQTLPPHNLFLFIACDYGWICFILFCTMLMKIIMSYVKCIKKNINSDVYMLMLAILILFPILSCVSSCNEQRKVVWLLLGVFIKGYYNAKSSITSFKLTVHKRRLEE